MSAIKIRIDELLVLRGLSPTRSQAKQLIIEGKVFCDMEKILKPAHKISKDANITVKEKSHYVSRGAKKLAAAIKAFKINPQDLIVADIGASTGGFTDLLLQHSAKKIYAIDVGHDQLAEKLKNDQRVKNMEGINIRHLRKLPEKIDLAVVDLSYISLKLVLKNIASLMKKNGQIIALFKPQFEAGPGVVGKDGVIKDMKKVEKILNDFLVWAKKENFKILSQIPSPIRGKQGNQEFLLHIKAV